MRRKKLVELIVNDDIKQNGTKVSTFYHCFKNLIRYAGMKEEIKDLAEGQSGMGLFEIQFW